MANRLKHFRVAAAMTQTAIAEAVGVTQPTYQRWEAGSVDIPDAKLAKLANVLQAQNPRGSLRGTVQDPTGARIPSAKVVAQSTDSSMRREAVSEDRGEFRLDDLLPGAYRMLAPIITQVAKFNCRPLSQRR